ncbi:hypothetical protein NT2_05_00920 [Caenibius tardaugens NBRC 16725]|uniref:Uncharacterized protein n=1 Tax=Caenibius tardaugens NBRC 16725 TaxID=1219035 RepID=U2Y7J0_9SPHN|nr:hypothetical protein [Caenibius tardaugens]AZI36530.1 hypothetical protein EGO55_11670 [Caenibius tardaugens NBRC 16725]GAD49171.1 hypothetical protein NT2_05_00920 [Caenibius tardaugens NBRC 16725]
MSIRSKIAHVGAWMAGIGAVAGYLVSWLLLPAAGCVESAYILSCESAADRLLHILGNFTSVLTAFVCALPGLVIYVVASSGQTTPPEQ